MRILYNDTVKEVFPRIDGALSISSLNDLSNKNIQSIALAALNKLVLGDRITDEQLKQKYPVLRKFGRSFMFTVDQHPVARFPSPMHTVQIEAAFNS